MSGSGGSRRPGHGNRRIGVNRFRLDGFNAFGFLLLLRHRGSAEYRRRLDCHRNHGFISRNGRFVDFRCRWRRCFGFLFHLAECGQFGFEIGFVVLIGLGWRRKGVTGGSDGGFFHFMKSGQFVLEMRIAIGRHSARRRRNGVRFGGSSFRRLESGQSILEGGREFTRPAVGGRDAGLINVLRRNIFPFENGASLHDDQIGVICNSGRKR